jgi:hypothetical protein
LIESDIESTPDKCRRWAVIYYFQKAFITKKEKETVLGRMTNEQIGELIEASSNVQAKIFYASFRKK